MRDRDDRRLEFTLPSPMRLLRIVMTQRDTSRRYVIISIITKKDLVVNKSNEKVNFVTATF